MDVSEERYDSLLKAEMILNELEVAGVEHWEGYPMVMDEIKKIEALKEKTEFFAESIMELLSTKIKPMDQDSGFYFEDGTKEELLAYFKDFGVVLDQQPTAVEPAV
jgi:hypothetical protein